MIRPKAILLLLATAMLSCSVGPDYQGPPELDLAAAFSQADGDTNAGSPSDERWWKSLGDRRLDSLVGDALAGNLDIAIAGQRIREARALRRQAAASLAPRLGTNLSLTRTELGGILQTDTLASLGAGLSLDSPIDIWQTDFEAGWELDVFGGKRRALRSAEARAAATGAAADGVRLAVAAEVTDAYFALASLREEKSLLLEQAASQKKQTQDLRLRRESGAASQLDLDRAVGRLETTRAEIPALDAGINTQTQRIALLLGKQAGALGHRLTGDLSRSQLPVRLPLVQSGIPAALLHRRPDLRQSEREVAAAAEDVGIAVASFYPSFRIGGGPTSFATSFGDLFDASRFIWQYGPSIEWNPFTGGANRAALDAATSRQKATLLAYEKAVLSAVSEVETQLARLRAETRRLALLQRAQTALSGAVDQVTSTYKAGANTFLDVLVEEERLREVQLALVRSKARLVGTWILLHKALGGPSPAPR